MRRCLGCGVLATRSFVDEYGTEVPLCSRCPSQQEIYSRAESLRKTWSHARRIQARDCDMRVPVDYSRVVSLGIE